MHNLFYQVFTPLLAAHFLGDFIFQTDNDIKNKSRTTVFTKHILLVTGLSYILTGFWNYLIIPIVILLSHTIIDLLKRLFKKDSLAVFLTDQVAHIIIIFFLTVYMQNVFIKYNVSDSFWLNIFGSGYYQTIIIITAIVLSTKFCSIIISYIIKPYQSKIFINEKNDNGSINTGRLIGYLERLIILVLFITDLPVMVGFLITAKSILRYGEIKNEKDKLMIEYVLIGTLLSFTLGISIAFIASKAIVNMN